MNPQSSYLRGVTAAQVALRSAGADPVPLALAAADALVRACDAAPSHECAPGCAFCCHFPVGATRAEIVHLARWLHAHRAPAERASLRERLRTASALGWHERAARREPCPLLGDDATCTVYAARPIACRGCNSTSRASCDDHHHGRAGAGPALDRDAWLGCAGIHDELARRGDGETFDLADGLARALGVPDPGDVDLATALRAGDSPRPTTESDSLSSPA